MNKRQMNLDWLTLHQDCRALANKLQEHGSWEGIVAIARGGLIPAAILARELDIRMVDTLCIASYEHDRQGELTVLKSVDHDGNGLLLVDDLVDSGETARVARKLLPNATFAVVYAKTRAREMADIFIREVDTDTWINFPWDTDETQEYVPPLAEQ